MSYFTEKTLKFSLYGGMIPIVTTTVKKIAQTIFFHKCADYRKRGEKFWKNVHCCFK